MSAWIFTQAVAILALGVAVATPEDLIDERQRRQALERYRTGQSYMHAEHWDKAEDEFRAAIALDPLLTLAHYDLGQTLMAVQRYREAVKAYLGCREAFQRIAALQQTDRIRGEQRIDDEIRELNEAIRGIRSGHVRTLSPQNAVLRLETRVSDLERQKKRNMENPESPAEVSLALGSAYFRSGAGEDAEREWLAAVKVNPKLGQAHNNLAVVYMTAGRYDEARERIRLAERAGFAVSPRFKADLESRAAAVKQP